MTSTSLVPGLELQLGVKASVDADLIAIFQEGGKRPVAPKSASASPYAATIERLGKSEAFTGSAAQTSFLRYGGRQPAESALLIGLGNPADLSEEKARVAGAHAYAKVAAEKCATATLHADTLVEGKGLPANLSPHAIVHAFVEGFLLSAYDFSKYKSQPSKKATFKKLIVSVTDKSLNAQLEEALPELRATAECIFMARDWSNEPSNFGTPEHYALEARKLAKTYGLKVKVLTERDAEREKMGLFLAVGQGAEREGRIVVVEYTPKGAKTRAARESMKTIALVGKGITFDSGGISIKPSLKMEEMKHDMTGAATVMAAVCLAAKMKVRNRVVGIMAFTENMPDGNAVQPGNVIRARNGKTVEIINTDAEGRLILADVLDYAQDLKPDAVVNIATLTGAVLVALGKQCCAVMGNDEKLVESLSRAGSSVGERMWQLPLYDEYFDDLKTDCADMRNSANDPAGGTIRGGIFLKQFIRKGQAWAHLDIAATAWGMGHVPYFPKKGASGAQVRTLARFAREF